MKTLLLCLGALIATTVHAAEPQQTSSTPKAAASAKIMMQIRKLDALIQIVPLNLKKNQIDAILLMQEKAQEKERQIRMLEDNDLEKLEPKLSTMVQSGIEKGTYPQREFQSEIANLTRAMGLRRQVASGEIVTDFYAGIKDVLDAGQKTIMAKSLNPALLSPGTKVDTMTEEDKIKFFIRAVFIDNAAYEVLKELRKTAS